MTQSPDDRPRYSEDAPYELRGSLIPRHVQEVAEARKIAQAAVYRRFAFVRTALPMMALLAVGLIGVTSYGMIARQSLPANPTLSIIDPYTSKAVSLSYGPESALSQKNVFIATRDTLIEEGETFIEIDLSQKNLRYFKRGVLLQSAEIISIGESGSWWDTPAGFYKIESTDERIFSSFAQVYLPSQIVFGGNYVIHGWPEYPDGSLVAKSFAGGGVRLDSEDAQELYEAIEVGIPVLIHAEEKVVDTFVYEPRVDGVTAEHYLIADAKTNAIIAASNLSDTAPIASLTKLMTAIIAAENLNLDSRVRVSSPNFITSLIPRLSDRSSVSMYSLLQLLLVESSNEAAEVMAAELDRDEFISLMNEKARHIGMLETNFADPSGLSASNTSSLGDLYRLTNYIYNNRPFILEITANTALPTTFVGDEFSGLVNFNEIEDMDNFIGGKVGETNAAGQTSVSLHRVEVQGEDRVLMVILLGSEDRSSDVLTLLSYIDERFER